MNVRDPAFADARQMIDRFADSKVLTQMMMAVYEAKHFGRVISDGKDPFMRVGKDPFMDLAPISMERFTSYSEWDHYLPHMLLLTVKRLRV